VRIRDAYPEESTETNAKRRIDQPDVQFVDEDSSAVVPSVKSESPHIGQLTLPRQSLLKGANPRELSVDRVTPYEWNVNLKTARDIGVTTPPKVLKRADRVIQWVGEGP
jgi:ABC-type uncharacterized transport system substrate-binding protein